MFRNEYVTLPEVNEYTDMVNISSLGLPVGFDQERLSFNIVAMEKSMKWGGLGHLAIRSDEGVRRNVDIDVNGTNDDGTASAVGRVATSSVKLQEVKLPGTGDGIRGAWAPHYYGREDALIKINATEKEQRIIDNEKKWPKGPFDPNAQAHFINKAIEEGLKSAALKKHTRSILVYSSLGFAAGASFGALIAGGFNALSIVESLVNLNMVHTVAVSCTQDLSPRERQWSLFWGVPFDRQLMARVHANRKLVKATDRSPKS